MTISIYAQIKYVDCNTGIVCSAYCTILNKACKMLTEEVPPASKASKGELVTIKVDNDWCQWYVSQNL